MHIKELLDELDIPYREAGESHHVTQNWLGVECPWCSPESGKFKLGVHLTGLHTSCWSCGGKRLIDFLHEATGRAWRECYELVGSLHGGVLRQAERVEGKLILPSGVGSLLAAHKHYLYCRGFSVKELSKLWGIMGIGLASSLAWRLFIPIHQHGKMVSWTTRSLTDHGARYVNARTDQEAVSAKTLLYGEDFARHAIILVEGPSDVWRIGPGAVATLGVVVSAKQIAKAARYPVRAVVFDNEPAAQERARELCNHLEAFPGTTHQVQLDAKDPGSASKREIQLLRKSFLE